ncbi:MAG: c-type cytochrome [Proteobacteria bacterium]|nr:c-type cytochrome [Pseudomonadota bacterium]
MRLPILCAFGASLLLSVQASAADKPQRLGLCASCHGENGHASSPDMPNLAGQNLAYLRSAIAQYNSGKRDFPAMRAALGMLNAQEVDAILVWYAQQPQAAPHTP